MAFVGSALVHASVPQMPAFIKAIQDTPKVQLRYMRGELKRGLNRMRKSFIQRQLQGPPGIKAGKLAKGKNVFTFVSGANLNQLGGKIGISRILHVHEKGMTIKAKGGAGLLYLRENKGTASEQVIAAVPQVVIPSRLKFVQQVRQETPEVLRKVGEAGARATQVTLSKGLLKGAKV